MKWKLPGNTRVPAALFYIYLALNYSSLCGNMGTNFTVYLLKSCTVAQLKHTLSFIQCDSDNVTYPSVFMCVRPCVRVYMLMPTCVYGGVRAYPPVCVCTFLGSARELTGAEKAPTVTEETDIDAEEVSHVEATEDLNANRGVTDLDATAKTTDLNHTGNKVHCPHSCMCMCIFFPPLYNRGFF